MIKMNDINIKIHNIGLYYNREKTAKTKGNPKNFQNHCKSTIHSILVKSNFFRSFFHFGLICFYILFIHFWLGVFSPLTSFLWKSFVHCTFLNFREDLKKIVCKLFFLFNPSFIHDFLFWDWLEGFNHFWFQVKLSFMIFFLTVLPHTFIQTILIKQLRINFTFILAKNEGNKLLSIFTRILKNFPHLLGKFQVAWTLCRPF